ncbi:MAG: phage protease [Azoarcus sp.]|nr:phage protease [Azoarcus sp.]
MTSVATASMVLEIALDAQGGIPDAVHLLPPGPFRAIDGRPRDVAAWQLDATIAAQVINRAAARKTDTLIDYEHQSLHAEWNGQPAPAAGWFRALEWRDAAGLYAVNVKWTDRARQMIAAREYRYVSAVFEYLPGTGEVLNIVSVAITNTPALDGLGALMAARRPAYPEEDADMADDAKLAALTVERDRLKTEVAVLTAERDAAQAQVAALTQEKAAAAQAAEKTRHGGLLAAALSDGRLTPALKPWAEKQSAEALAEYLTAQLPSAVLARQADGAGKTAAALTAEEAAMAERFGVSHEDFLKAREK